MLLRKTMERTKLYEELRDLYHNMDVVKTAFDFECPICLEQIEADKGIQLKECLHVFCKECISQLIKSCDDVEIRCPIVKPNCEAIIQQREIKALVSKDVYEKIIARSMERAFNVIPNTFHCQTPDCSGWWAFEDKVHLYRCPICNIVNCTDCKAIHEGLECQVYQDMKNINNVNEHRSTVSVLKLINERQALQCPGCGVVVMKISGCSGIICTMCKIEICWATRGPRWGPAGKGDTSGGCRCGVNDKRCHPNCNNCH